MEFNLVFNDKQFEMLLKRIIKHEHSELISKTIIDAIKTNYSPEICLSHIYNALSGIEPISKFKVLDKVWINLNQISSWRYDMEKTKETYEIRQNHIQGEVISVNLYQYASYTVKVELIDSNGNKVIVDETISDKNLHKIEDLLIE